MLQIALFHRHTTVLCEMFVGLLSAVWSGNLLLVLFYAN